MDIGFVWDEAKYQEVQAKHLVQFYEAVSALDDPNGFETADSAGYEDRFMWVGSTAAGRVLAVVTPKKSCRSVGSSLPLMPKEDCSMNTEPEPEFDYQAHMRSLPPRGGEGEPDLIKIHRGPEARQKRWKAAACYNRGNAKGVLGRHEEAIADYDEALQINPQLAAAYYNRGNAKGVLGRHEEAIADYDEALRIDPQLAAAYCNRGNVKDVLGRHEEAIADYDEALRIDPQLAAAYYNREAAKIKLQRTSLAP